MNHRMMRRVVLLGLACASLLAALLGADTVQDFDVEGQGTPFTSLILVPEPAPGVMRIPGGPTGGGSLLRMAFGDPDEIPEYCALNPAECPETCPGNSEDCPLLPNQNSITFDLSRPGAWNVVIADFDLRLEPAFGRADGFGFALLNTDPAFPYGATEPVGVEGPLFAAEEPNFQGSLGIGFDIHQAGTQSGVGADLNNNHVSIHFNGVEQGEFDATPVVDLGGGQWVHVRVILRPGFGFSDVSVILTPCSGDPVLLIDRFRIPGFTPYEGRVHFAARSGGESAEHDLDNVRVQFLDTEPEVLSLSRFTYTVLEGQGNALVAVDRAGDAQGTVSVEYATADGDAIAGEDYTSTDGVLTFLPNERTKTFTVPVATNALMEGDRRFEVFLENASVGTVLGGPVRADVDIIDDETARALGHWSPVLCWPLVPIHLHLLPTGKVLFWGTNELGQVRIWDPETEELEQPAGPGHDIFCSGHSFLADGRLLVTGGNIEVGPGESNSGLPNASAYDPFTDSWEGYPDMNDGRWYPTNVTLPDGNVVVESGLTTDSGEMNTLPQVLDVEERTWRDLVVAQTERPPMADIYPRLFLSPDGRVFKAGQDPDTWFLDTAGQGRWIQGPLTAFDRPRLYGPAVFFDGQVLLVGGGDPPTNSVEIIDLTRPDPQWRSVAPLAAARRHHNATLLPDGQVLVTTGTSSPGFNDAADAAFAAEAWDPATETWSTLAAMQTSRVYHSTAILLPDGRVLVAGGGQPQATGDFDHRDAEIYSPPYLFQGPRPTVNATTPAVGYGEAIEVVTPDASSIAKVTLIRLGSVTHAFDQNQRLVTAPFSQTATGLSVMPPANPNLVPPGHYLLFLLNDDWVPSVGRIVQIADQDEIGDRCTPSDTILCIDDQPSDRRFKVTVSFATAQGGGLSGDARATPLSSLGISKGGIFSFTDPANPEVLVKVLNGCSITNHFWVFFAATTNVGFTLCVEDTVAEVEKCYTNPDQMTAETVTDTMALATCP